MSAAECLKWEAEDVQARLGPHVSSDVRQQTLGDIWVALTPLVNKIAGPRLVDEVLQELGMKLDVTVMRFARVGQSQLGAYMHRVVQRLVLDLLRAERRNARFVTATHGWPGETSDVPSVREPEAGLGSNPEVTVVGRDVEAHAMRCIKQLRRQHSEWERVFSMVARGHSGPHIANVLRHPVGTVYGYTSQARAFLRRCLAHKGIEVV